MNKTFIIGVIWSAIIIGILSFGATVFYLEKDARKTKKELVENEEKKVGMIYETDQTAIRTNQMVSLEMEKEGSNYQNKQEKERNSINNELLQSGESYKILEEPKAIFEKVNEKVVESINPNGKSFIRPVKGEILRPFSSNELIYSNTLQEWNIHKGTDYKAKIGEEVVAIRSGTVKIVATNDLYGEYIVIDHGEGLESLCANLTVLDALKPGITVKQGQLIGYVAESYGFEVEEETHLHFELKNGTEYLSL